MNYPIDADKYITAMRMEFCQNANAERIHRAIIPFVNDCYAAGLRGAGGYPLDLGREAQALADRMGKPLEDIRDNPLLSPLIALANRVYAQGREDAAKGEYCGTLG